MEYRIEQDTMGEVKVPKDALYRAQTQRAVENFTARDPDNLRRSEVGDIVVIKIVQAIGIAVGLDIKTLEQ